MICAALLALLVFPAGVGLLGVEGGLPLAPTIALGAGALCAAVAPARGGACALAGLAAGAAALAGPWTMAWAASAADGAARLPFPLGGGLVLAGALTLGMGVGLARGPWVSVGRAALLVALAAALDHGPTAWAWLADEPPLSPRGAALALDLSPRAVFMESSGVDWMRQSAVYGPAGTDRIGPDLRAPYGGVVAGSCLLLIGWTLLGARLALRGRRPAP